VLEPELFPKIFDCALQFPLFQNWSDFDKSVKCQTRRFLLCLM
jgi:hypothetical protein